ncbi:Cys-tRNA(Pro) deacylase [Tissierella sp. Yu-01]|uniref:Cys-tRNA(Pro) deacylase n=1 Tax=Tissierella sp. Yu-01 TaxID=3035694 RepID=UPI00240DAB62|nr:Cys-tRNA(Pro) deacylase [Tissierella sp. Yu-01]WFA09367.1 Cys-tRNA(Pro) deacylase [Tissierella sp. Yu-01]
MANLKTNAMRLLEKAKTSYKIHTYENKDGQIDGISVAEKIGLPVEKVYKTLVTQGHSKEYYVFVIPVAEELDLKAAAKAVGDKSVAMIHVADINKVTGYIRGGCSPIGMKKNLKTVIDSSCNNIDTIIVSAGKIGYQIELNPSDLLKLISGKVEDIIMR